MDKEQLVGQLKAEIRHNLDNLTDRLVAELKPIIEAEHDPDTYLLDFEVEMQDLTRGFPVGWVPMDRNVCQLFGGPQPQLLTDIPHTVPEKVAKAKIYEEAGIDTWEIAFDLLIPWFSQCWRLAGGEKCRYPAYIGHHDDLYSRDLNTLQEVEYEDKWPE